jgi:cytoskeletal protein CcmA (bactofilin family)
MKSGIVQMSAPTDLRTRLGEGMEVAGEVKFAEVLRVDGRVSGKIISESGNLIISEQGQVQAAIETGFVEVFGAVEGTITARYKVEIHSGGRVYGDIYTPILNIEPGAVFDGKCHMIEEGRKEAKGNQFNQSAPPVADKDKLFSGAIYQTAEQDRRR